MKWDFSFYMFKNNLVVCLFNHYADIHFPLFHQRNYKEWKKDTALLRNLEDAMIRENSNRTTVDLMDQDKNIVPAS